MDKNGKVDKVMVFIIIIFVILGSIIIGFWGENHKISKNKQMFVVDSISVDLRYPNLPDKVWFYHTELGVFTSNKELCSVGDSIEVGCIFFTMF